MAVRPQRERETAAGMEKKSWAVGLVGCCSSHRETVNWNGNGKETLGPLGRPFSIVFSPLLFSSERCTSSHIICYSKILLTITIDRSVERTGEFCLIGNLSYFLN